MILHNPKVDCRRGNQKPHGMILGYGTNRPEKQPRYILSTGNFKSDNCKYLHHRRPIEYKIQGINQSQINPKVGFTLPPVARFSAPRSKHYYGGEIRDQETVEIAIHAAMTGHLVLSTLHTNDAPTTLPRLVDMGVPPFLVAYTTNIVMAQRLVRKICTYCKEEFNLTNKWSTNWAKILTSKNHRAF